MNFIPNESPSKMGFMSVIRVIIASEIIEMSWIICQNAVILYDFHSSGTYFHKNSSRFVISIKNWIYRHLICTFLTKKNFSKKSWLYPENIQTKNFKAFFELKYLDLYISRCSFWRRLRIWYYFCWKM